MFLRSLFIILCLFLGFSHNAYAAKYDTWTQIAEDMNSILDDSYNIYASGNIKDAKDKVNEAYYQYYEKLGFEKTTKFSISGKNASLVEFQFGKIKKSMTKELDNATVKECIAELKTKLLGDANTLDSLRGSKDSSNSSENKAGTSDNGSDQSTHSKFWFFFISSFLILLREGFEAILIVGAIVAYLKKTNNQIHVRSVYKSSVWAIVVSLILAFGIYFIADGNGGANQEILEGLTCLFAVAVLFYVSNFMLSKADSEVWIAYIKGKVESSLVKNNIFALSLAAFLAVFREGAEVILFYFPILSEQGSVLPTVAGSLSACLILVLVFYVINFLSVKLPLKPFFIVSSFIMFVMCISFVGAGVSELQEADLVSYTEIPWLRGIFDAIPYSDVFGLFPFVETVVPQVVMLILTLISVVVSVKNWKKYK